jgi:uncharacterized protein
MTTHSTPSLPASATAAATAELRMRAVHDIREIGATEWDACAGGEDPFVSHAFLAALEESGSAGADTGWLPCHLAVEDAAGRLFGAAPLYLKTHSWGEYVFDHSWADAYERAGGRYYPKLQAAVPFTPVGGKRLLLRPGETAERVEEVLIGGYTQLTDRLKASSVHVTFCREGEWRRLIESGFLGRTGLQCHWENRDYGTFDDFVGALRAPKRKSIRKERQAVRDQGVTIELLNGTDLEPRHWAAFYPFYRNTVDHRWGQAYLTRRFFELLGERMPDRVLLVMAKRDRRYVAGALNLIGSDTLYGRNWGCREEVPFLHFEACYYSAIEFAIARGLKRVEAGAQGIRHKLQRGYLPRKTFSAHFIRDPRLRDAVRRFLETERFHIDHELAGLGEHSPYREG